MPSINAKELHFRIRKRCPSCDQDILRFSTIQPFPSKFSVSRDGGKSSTLFVRLLGQVCLLADFDRMHEFLTPPPPSHSHPLPPKISPVYLTSNIEILLPTLRISNAPRHSVILTTEDNNQV